MISNIIELVATIPHGYKSKAILAVSEATGLTFNTVKMHWLSESGGYSVPVKHQKQVVKVLQNFHKEVVSKIEVIDPKEVK